MKTPHDINSEAHTQSIQKASVVLSAVGSTLNKNGYQHVVLAVQVPGCDCMVTAFADGRFVIHEVIPALLEAITIKEKKK